MSVTEASAPKLSVKAEKERAKKKAQARAAFLRLILKWHWISAAVCLIGMMLFAITGVTLNHAGQIKAEPKVISRDGVLPQPLTAELAAAEEKEGPLPDSVRTWLKKEIKVSVPAKAAVEWSPGEGYVGLPGPGADAFVTMDTETGDVAYEQTSRGWIAYINDLHKGRNTGVAWSWFIDIFALGCVVFTITGLVLLQLHSHARRITWPLVGLGLIIPFLIALLFIH